MEVNVVAFIYFIFCLFVLNGAGSYCMCFNFHVKKIKTNYKYDVIINKSEICQDSDNLIYENNYAVKTYMMHKWSNLITSVQRSVSNCVLCCYRGVWESCTGTPGLDEDGCPQTSHQEAYMNLTTNVSTEHLICYPMFRQMQQKTRNVKHCKCV